MYSYYVWISALSVSISAHQINNNELPEYINRCKDNAEISECTKRVLEELKPRIVKGIPEFHLPSIDPLYIPLITIERRNSRIADYTANVTNAHWTGCKDFQVMEVFLNLNELIFRLKLGFPYLLLDAEAYLGGTFRSFEVDGSGRGLINYTNVILDIVLNGQQYEHKEKEFIKWEIEDIGVTYDDVYYLDLSGFFEDATVTHLLKLAVNRAARLLGNTYRPLVSSVAEFIVNAINRVFKLYSRNALYPI